MAFLFVIIYVFNMQFYLITDLEFAFAKKKKKENKVKALTIEVNEANP